MWPRDEIGMLPCGKRRRNAEGEMPRRKPTTTPAPAGSRLFPVYRALEVGGGSKGALVQALDRNGCYVGRCAREMIARASFTPAGSSRTIKLARVQPTTPGVTDWG